MVYRGRGSKQRGGGGDVRGRGRGGGGGRGRGRGGGRGSFPHNLSENTHHGFSLADEAKNTERHHGDYAGSGALRYSKISFVAAGHLESADLLKPLNTNVPLPSEGQQQIQSKVESSTDSTEDEEDAPMQADETDSPVEASTGILPQEVDIKKLDLDPPEQQAFVVDVTGDPSLKPEEQVQAPMSPAGSPEPARPGSSSSSASEKIVFVPRKMRPTLSRANSPMKSRATSRIPSRIASPQQYPKQLSRQEPVQETMQAKIVETTIAKATVTTDNNTVLSTPAVKLPDTSPLFTLKKTLPSSRSTTGNKRRRHKLKEKFSEEDAVIEDYIENITAQMRAEAAEGTEDVGNYAGGESSDFITGTTVNRRDLGGEDSWSSTTDSEGAAEDSDAINDYKASMWEEYELNDLDDISTDSEGPKGPVDTVLGKRNRPSGLQYLVKWSGYDTDDVTWVLAETLDSSASDKIKSYEKVLAQKTAEVAAAADGSEDDEEHDNDEDAYDEDDDQVDSDLKLAKLLQRQEVMGVAGSDLGFNLELDAFMDLNFPRKGSKKSHKAKTPLPDITPNSHTGFFPSASRLADTYDDFNPMEWERPSLATAKGQLKGKKRKGKVVMLELSDSDLEESIQNSWQKDREKKKARKAQREALRSEGLLGGGKGSKRDPKARWKEGMDVEDLQKEITGFLLSEHQSTALPPMNKADRKLVHTLAGAFGIKSKSVGKGKSRFTTLYKTSRSSTFERDEATIAAVMSRKHFLNRPDIHVGRGGRGEARTRGPGRGGSGGVVHHREGDIVGASAPEIAEDNKGRRMLEKMGYKSGMALGMEGNKGIMMPVAAVVKISKAGLG